MSAVMASSSEPLTLVLSPRTSIDVVVFYWLLSWLACYAVLLPCWLPVSLPFTWVKIRRACGIVCGVVLLLVAAAAVASSIVDQHVTAVSAALIIATAAFGFWHLSNRSTNAVEVRFAKQDKKHE